MDLLTNINWNMLLTITIDVLENGFAWALVALGVYLSFRIINVPDLTVDGTLTLGAAATARLLVGGVSPLLATLAGTAAGMLGGLMTGLLHTRLKIQPLLAGILTMTFLYSVNLRVMGRANIALINVDTIVPNGSKYGTLLLFAAVAIFLKVLIDLFLKTDLGLALRATGNNEQMVRTFGVSSDSMKVLGLVLSNGMVGLGGSMLAQYSGFADAQMGIGTVVIGLASVILGEIVFGSRSVFRATLAVVLGSILYRAIYAMALRSWLNASDMKMVTAILVILALSTTRIKNLVRA